jgi:hypothetical protein
MLASMKDYPMPQAEEMTWLKGPKRWKRQFMGKVFWVSPRQLGCRPTKEESLQAANSWMRQQIADYYAGQGTAQERAILAIETARKLAFASNTMAEYVLPHLVNLGLPDATRRLTPS